MKIAFWRRLRLRTRTSNSNSVNLMFYDISFAASVSAAAYALRSTMLECHDCQDSLLALGSLVLTFVPMWWNTYLLNLYSHRFATEDLFFTVYVYLQVLANVLMAVNTLDCGTSTSGDECNILFWNNLADDSFAAFACTQAASQFLAACMFARGIHIPQARSWSMLYALAQLVTAVLWAIASSFQDGAPRAVLVVLSLLIHLAVEYCAHLPSISPGSALPNYLGERMRKFVIVMMTLVVSGTVSVATTYDSTQLLAAAGMAAIAILFKLVYFDLDNGDKAETDYPATELVWVVSNLVLCLCLNVAGACSTAIVLDPHGRDTRGTSRIHWVLCGATSVGLLASTATRSARRADGAEHITRRWGPLVRVSFRCAGAAAIAFVPVVAAHASPLSVVWIVAAMLAVQACGDIFGGHKLVPGETAPGLLRTWRDLCWLCLVSNEEVPESAPLVADSPSMPGTPTRLHHLPASAAPSAFA